MITVSLETAKKLKEAWWDKYTQLSIWRQWNIDFTDNTWESSYQYLYAPTAQEILDELPKRVCWAFLEARLWWDEKIIINYHNAFEAPIWQIVLDSKNLAEAFASLRLRCKENNHLN